jgi:hypothetical protein
MTVRFFVIGSAATALVGWTIFSLIINWLDPVEAGWMGYLLFFLALFLSIMSTTSLIGYGLRYIVVPRQLPAYRVRYSLRQGILLAAFTDVLLLLQLLRVARWWLVLLLLVLFLSIEFIFLTYDRAATRHQRLAE